MSLKIEFDAAGNPVMPTLILARHSGYKLGNLIAPYNMKLVGTLRESPEFSFTVNKEEPLWKDIIDFKLIYVMEWDTWLQIQVELIDGYSITKNVDAQGLCKSELSQLLLHGLEFNTDEDIEMDDYKRRIIYNPWDKDASILSAIMDKAPHYKIKYVDESIAKLQKTFSFDGTSIDDALNEICDECDAIVIYNDGTDEETGMPAREISIYDLETICQNENCKYRGDFSDVCPQCGGTDLKYGYGQDTTIFVSKEMLTNEVQYTSDVDSIKNTFKLEAGDDVMTAAIRACNPNGTDYIQYINEETKHDMPEELVQKIDEYEDLFQYYQKEYVLDLDQELIDQYNNLIDDEYKDYNIDVSKIGYDEEDNMITLVGYPSLMNVLYDIIDFELVLQSSLMPVDQNTETNAEAEAAKLTAANIGTIALDIKYNFELPMVNSIVLSMASYVVDKRYAVKIKDADTNHIVDDPNGTKRWTGIFIVYDPSGDVSVESDQVTLELSTVTEAYVKQRVKKIMAATEDTKDHTVSHLLDIETSLKEFNNEIKWFNIDELYSINDTCMSCMDTLQISGFADKDGRTTQQQSDNYTFYMNYYNKQSSILDEIYRKENQMNVIREVENYIMNVRNEIQDTLNFENYLGTDLYKIFCTYRREDIYSNENYISDGLNNAEIFQNAREFYDIAAKEIYKSAVLQHSITSTLKNLLVIPEFAPIKDYFELGNWIRVEVDGEVNRLRLIRYEIDFENLPEITIEFSDVTRISDGISDIQSLLSKSSSMASSYGAVMHQMNSVQKTKVSVANWIKNGFDATKTKIVNDDGKQDVVIDNHGVLVRSYDDVTQSYADTQMKFINSTLAITDDNWQTIKTALGNFIYQDPESAVYYEAYGLIAETIVGDLILGRTLKIYNDSGNMTFDDDGLRVSNGINNVVINPNSDKLFSVNKGQDPMLWFDEEGMLHIEGGDGAGLDISTNSAITGLQTQFSVTASEIRGEITNVNNNLQTILSQTADQIRMEVLNTNSQLSASISVLEGKIRSEVLDQVNSSMSSFEQTADRISLQVQDLAGQMQNINTDFSVVAGEIRGELYDKITEVGSIISQKENSIRSQVSDVANGLSSEILQTKNSIMSQVQNENEEIYTRINQTDKDITAMVNNEINQINTLIYQNDSEIRLVVKNYADGLASIIQQKDDAIRLSVEDNNRKMQSSLSVYADKIESLVGETSQITQTINKILLRVGDSGIEITDGLITAVAEKINMYGLITFNGLEDYTKSMLNKFRNDIDRIDIGLKQAVYLEDVYEIITTESGHSVTYSFDDPPANDPNNEYIDGDLWYKQLQNSDGSNSTHMEIYLRTGNTWVKNDDNKVRIANGTITADMIAANAITANKFSGSELASLNYLPPSPNNATDYAVGYAQAGSLFDLAGGGIYTPNFVVKNTTYTVQDENGQNHTVQGNGEVYIRGTIYATNLILGGPTTKIVNNQEVSVNLATDADISQAITDFRQSLDIPESITNSHIKDIIANYNSDIQQNGNKLVFGNSIQHNVVTRIENGVEKQYDEISVNDNVTYQKIYHEDSDFVLLGRPVIEKDNNGNEKTRTNDHNINYIAISKNGLLEADNAIIYGTIYATNGEFSGTLKAAEIIAGDNDEDQEGGKETSLTYNGRSIVHQLINDDGGGSGKTMYRAVLGKAGNFHLQGNIFFAQPVAGTDNATTGRDNGYGILKGKWLGNIIKDIYTQISLITGEAEYTEITVDWNNVYNKPSDILYRLNNNGYSATLQSDGDFNLSSGNFYVPEGCTYKIGDSTIQDIFATKAELSGYLDSKTAEEMINNVTCSSIGAATSDHHHTEIHNNSFHFAVTSYGFSCSDGCLTANTYIKAKGADSNSDGLIADVGNINAKDGNVYGKNISGSSDERMKNIIQPIDDSYLKVFRDLTPIVFDWKSNVNQHHFGLGAQTTKKIFEDNGHCDFDIAHYYQSNDSYYINYNDLSALTMYAAQYNMDNIEKLQEKLTYMEKENKVLKKYISELADKIERLSAKIN